MASYEDVRRIGMAFPEALEGSSYRRMPALKVRGRPFCRLWSPREHERDGIHDGEVLVVFCDPEAKEALIEASGGGLFETPHYEGHGAVLVHLPKVSLEELGAYLEWSYRLRAPRRLVDALHDG